MLTEDLQKYLKEDRQWFRSQRIAHALYKRKIATTRDEKQFWTAVLEANEAFK
jgi:hypothetical protein